MDPASIPENENPYHLLHLREGAPRDLVEEAYWLLMRQQFDRANGGGHEHRQRVRALNRAYEAIARNGHSDATPHQRRAARVRRAGLLRRKRSAVWKGDPHETLFVSVDADHDLAQLARRVLLDRVPQGLTKAQWDRALVEAAAHIERASESEHVALHDDAARDDETYALASLASSVADPSGAGTSEPHEDAGSERHATEARAPRPAPADEAVVPPATRVPGDAEIAADGTAAAVILDWVRGRKAKRAEVIEEQNERLLMLRMAPPPDDEPAGPRASMTPEQDVRISASDEPAVRPANLISMADKDSERLLRAEQIADEVHERTLGTGSDVARVQIWRRGSRYLLQQVSGPPVAVNGVLLQSPIVVLDDGDEIAHGSDKVELRLA